MDLVEFAKQDYAIIGKTISVYTLDGNKIKGVVRKADVNLLGIEHEDGFFIINTSAIASLFIGRDDQ